MLIGSIDNEILLYKPFKNISLKSIFVPNLLFVLPDVFQSYISQYNTVNLHHRELLGLASTSKTTHVEAPLQTKQIALGKLNPKSTVTTSPEKQCD